MSVRLQLGCASYPKSMHAAPLPQALPRCLALPLLLPAKDLPLGRPAGLQAARRSSWALAPPYALDHATALSVQQLDALLAGGLLGRLGGHVLLLRRGLRGGRDLRVVVPAHLRIRYTNKPANSSGEQNSAGSSSSVSGSLCAVEKRPDKSNKQAINKHQTVSCRQLRQQHPLLYTCCLSQTSLLRTLRGDLGCTDGNRAG